MTYKCKCGATVNVSTKFAVATEFSVTCPLCEKSTKLRVVWTPSLHPKE